MTQAAERLLLSQPAVSLHVRELEHELEAVLFERHGPRISLTRAGECLYQLAMPLVEGMNRLPDVFAEEHDDGNVSGVLNVASGDAGTVYVLPRVLKRLRDQSPGIRVRVSTSVFDKGLDLLLDDEVELLLGAAGDCLGSFGLAPH